MAVTKHKIQQVSLNYGSKGTYERWEKQPQTQTFWNKRSSRSHSEPCNGCHTWDYSGEMGADKRWTSNRLFSIIYWLGNWTTRQGGPDNEDKASTLVEMNANTRGSHFRLLTSKPWSPLNLRKRKKGHLLRPMLIINPKKWSPHHF